MITRGSAGPAGPIAFTAAPRRRGLASTVQPLNVGAAAVGTLCRSSISWPTLIASRTVLLDAPAFHHCPAHPCFSLRDSCHPAPGKPHPLQSLQQTRGACRSCPTGTAALLP